MYNLVNPSFTVQKWGLRVVKLYRYVFVMVLLPYTVPHLPNVFKYIKKLWRKLRYSRLPLSRPRLSRISAYLEEKIFSPFKHWTLTTGINILWKELQESNYIYICEMWLFDLFILFPQFCKSDMSRHKYLEVFQMKGGVKNVAVFYIMIFNGKSLSLLFLSFGFISYSQTIPFSAY